MCYRSGLRQNLPKQVAETFTSQIHRAAQRHTSRRYSLTMSKSGLGTRRTGIAKQAGNAPRIDTIIMKTFLSSRQWQLRDCGGRVSSELTTRPVVSVGGPTTRIVLVANRLRAYFDPPEEDAAYTHGQRPRRADRDQARSQFATSAIRSAGPPDRNNGSRG